MLYFRMLLCIFALTVQTVTLHAQARRTENVILITLDGVRSQELFGGADKAVMNKEYGGVRDPEGLARRFWRAEPEVRREVLLPFIWGIVAKEGQIFGDRSSSSPVAITNRLYFSYPGYNEILCGFADSKIDSNEKKPNANTTVLEFLNGKEPFKGKVEAYTCWDVFPFIINARRSGIPVVSGHDLPYANPKDDRQRLLNTVAEQMPVVWPGVCFDIFRQLPAVDAIREKRVRVLYIAFGESDDWAHDKRYDCYLDAISRCDQHIKELWETVQSIPEYKDKTTLVITTDHGRGDNAANWTSHGNKARSSESAWIAVLGPDTPAMGVRKKTPTTQGQVAATVAQLLGEDLSTIDQRVAKPLPGVMK